MLFRSHRALVRTLAVSLLAHAALLVGVSRMLPVRVDVPGEAITAVMRPRAPAGVPTAVAPAEPQGRPPAAPALDKAKAAVKKLAIPDSPVRDHVVPAAPPAPAGPEAEAPSASAGSAGRRGPDGPPSPGLQPQAGAAPPSPQEGVNAADVTDYRFDLGANARRFKRYPALARERGWEGTAEVAVEFRRLQAEPAISLAVSTGKKILDDQALEMIRRAVRESGLPPPLRGKDFRMQLEIVFSLEDDP